MMFPVSTVLEASFLQQKPNEPDDAYYWRQNKLRTGVVCLTAFVAWTVPDFSVFVSFVGSSICMLLAFVLPALFHLKTFPEQELDKRLVDYGFIAFGVVMGVLGTYQSGKRLLSVVFGHGDAGEGGD